METTTIAALAPLKEVLDYKNDHVVRNFMKNFDVSYEDAALLFQETLKWLYLGAYVITNKEHEKRRIAITDNIVVLDEMWHTFILFTNDYTHFCKKNFGFYIHHQPTTHEESNASIGEAQSNPNEYLKKVKEEYKQQLSLVYDILGKETVQLWYGTFADLYTKEKLQALDIKYR